jgi:hypothetical protein
MGPLLRGGGTWRLGEQRAISEADLGADMDTDLPQPTHPATHAMQGDGAGKASAVIGSEGFVERVLRAMTQGARQATEENAALEHRPTKP